MFCFGTDYNRPSYELINVVEKNHKEQQELAAVSGGDGYPTDFEWGSDWRKEVEEEKRLHGAIATQISPAPDMAHEHDDPAVLKADVGHDFHDYHKEDGDHEMYEHGNSLGYEGHLAGHGELRGIGSAAGIYSQETTTPIAEAAIKQTLAPTTPTETDVKQTLPNAAAPKAVIKQTLPTAPPKQATKPPFSGSKVAGGPAPGSLPSGSVALAIPSTDAFAVSSIPTSKSSSVAEASSEDEDQDSQPTPKKARKSLDYDEEQLKTMSYSNLSKQPFDVDPRAAATRPRDEHGEPLSLERRLANMSLMKEKDIRAMFANQTDEEWEQTGSWFAQQFADKMKKLVDIRHERRMIALEYEMEIKRRQAAVQAKTEEVEGELKELKDGSKELLSKRASPPK